MQSFRVNTIAELEILEEKYSENALFRGQTTNYEEDGFPSVSPSFDRLGCIPSEMGKWCRFASGAIKYWLGASEDNFELSQAILQHYGWRSFFIDLSSNLAVSSWFASHVYSQKFQIEMAEDCFETDVWLRKTRASYSVGSLVGNIYVFDKSCLEGFSDLIPLEHLEVDAERPRFKAQNAWMLGPLRNQRIPVECFLAHITAPHELLAEYSQERGFSEVSQLFPDRNRDPVLGSLLDLPWMELDLPKSEIDVPVFKRAISFPEYHDSFLKNLPPHVALYRGHNVGASDLGKEVQNEFTFFNVPDLVVYGSPQFINLKLSEILRKLEVGKTLCFEVDTLLRQAYAFGSEHYCKGISVKKHEENLLQVAEFAVDHPGMVVSGVGINAGWYYEVDKNEEWSRVHHPSECPCGDDARHEFLFGCLTIVEDWLADPESFIVI